MADHVQQYADKEEQALAKKLKAIYKQAAIDVKRKMEEFQQKHAVKSAKMLAEVKAGTRTMDNYQDWLKGQVFIGKQWEQKLKDITNVYTNADQKARDLLTDTQRNIFTEAANYTAYDLEKGMRGAISFNLYDKNTVRRLLRDNPQMLPKWKIDQPKDYTWNAQRVRKSVTQGIIQGESVAAIGKRLFTELAASNAKKMIMFARTAVTGAQNAGRIERLQEATDMGIHCRKRWLATLDDRTRDTHQDLDGQEREINQPFEVAGMTIDYPGDPNAPAELVFNCRCTLTYSYPKYGTLRGERRDQLNDTNIEDMTYYEWVGLKKSGK